MKKIVFFIFLSFIFYLSASESRFPISDENKELYSKVYDEAQYVLQKNHFNNELSFEKSDVVKKYINQIDNQKLIFTQNEIPRDSILVAAHDAQPEPWTHDLRLHFHQDLCLCTCFFCLWCVDVHFISVKVCIIGVTCCRVYSKRLSG